MQQTNWYTNFGPLLEEYEHDLSIMTGAGERGGNCVALSSGTLALELGITAIGIPSGTPVLLPSFTFPATILAVLRCGLLPVLSDVNPSTWTLTPEIATVAGRYRRFGLILPVAAFGLPLPVHEWDQFTRETGVPVLMDAAAALGHQRIGSLTHAIYSLHATKPLGIGEGGIFATGDPELAERVRRMSNFGFNQGEIVCSGGTNAKLSEYAAAVGLAQLARWPTILNAFRRVWTLYQVELKGLRGVQYQPFSPDMPPSVLSVQLPGDSRQHAETLAQAGIETRHWYLPPLHGHRQFAKVERSGPCGDDRLPVTDNLTPLGLPFHSFLTEQDIHTVSGALQRLLAGLAGQGVHTVSGTSQQLLAGQSQ
ncbi:MAG: DegT/DnrJ/EryC1/StrS family aminotransferase [Magnetococcus sp. DMHC-1]|nr:DegT/DnrJ/EryC1/StrS family aminotransferase [Magnetococcales bacterium]